MQRVGKRDVGMCLSVTVISTCAERESTSALPRSAPPRGRVTLLQFVKHLLSTSPLPGPTPGSRDTVDSQGCHPLLCTLSRDTHSQPDHSGKPEEVWLSR